MAKSAFDKLFDQVIKEDFGGDEEALGLDTGSDVGGDEGTIGIGSEDEGSSEETDEVTFTLDRETASKLIEVLQSALGESEESEESEEEVGGEDEGSEGEGDEGSFGSKGGEEGEEEGPLGESPQAGYEDFGVESKSKVLQGKGQQKVSGQASSVVSGKAQQTSQTAGTEKYMPAKTTVKNGIDVESIIKPSGRDKSAFTR